LKKLDGKGPESKALGEELKSLTETKRAQESELISPDSLLGAAVDVLKNQKIAYYWCGTIPVGTKLDPMDPLGIATIDDPEIRPHPPFFTTIIAGISFPQYIEPISRRGGTSGEQERVRLNGEVHILREDQVLRIAAEMPLTYVDWTHRTRLTQDEFGNRKRLKIPTAQKVMLRSEEYIREAEDDAKSQNRRSHIIQPRITATMKPIGLYVYMVKVVDENGRLAGIPKPVSQLGISLP